jgi:hypothetical protein
MGQSVAVGGRKEDSIVPPSTTAGRRLSSQFERRITAGELGVVFKCLPMMLLCLPV